MLSAPWTRRTVLHHIAVLALGVLSRPAGVRAGTSTVSPAGTATDSLPAPTRALSLRVLQSAAVQSQQKRQPLSEACAHLGGLTCLQGFLVAPDGEVILLGSETATQSGVSVDDLAIALRSAYQVSRLYQEVPGCSIDPWGARDPWRIQRVRILGMPASAMAARHVAIDYAMKQASAALISLGPDIPSLYDMTRATAPPCSEPRTAESQIQMTHRFWFYPRHPQQPPRYLMAAGVTLVCKPVGVQLLTEQEFLDRTGQRVGATSASPQAEQWARLVTEGLAADRIVPFAPLYRDFRLLEFGKLLHVQQVAVDNLHYLLYEHTLTTVTVPGFVGGVRRDEREEVVCTSQITEHPGPKGTRVETHEQVQRSTRSFRGGVEARIHLLAEQVVQEHSGRLEQLRRQVLAARPAPQALAWPITT